MITVIIRDKVTHSYIGEIDIFRDEIQCLETEFIVIRKQS